MLFLFSNSGKSSKWLFVYECHFFFFLNAMTNVNTVYSDVSSRSNRYSLLSGEALYKTYPATSFYVSVTELIYHLLEKLGHYPMDYSRFMICINHSLKYSESATRSLFSK